MMRKESVMMRKVYSLLLVLVFIMYAGGVGRAYPPPVYTDNCNNCHKASGGFRPNDTTAPTVTDFIIPSNWDSLIVPVTSFNVLNEFYGVSFVEGLGFMITETSSAPDSWDPSPPAEYEFAAPGKHTLYAWAKDGAGNVSQSASAQVTITLPTANTAPQANAGDDRSVTVGETVVLNGGGSSDVDGDSLTYHWSLTPPAGSSAVLKNGNSVSPSFAVDRAGSYVAQLIVNDGELDSAPDTVTISTSNSAPVADAGPDKSVSVGETVALNGSGSSDADGDPLTYRWSLTPPAGSSAVLKNGNTVSPSFAVDRAGSYVAQLIVNDGDVDSAPDTVTVSTTNSSPVADAGPDRTASVGETVVLDGSGSSDVDGQSLTFSWSLTKPVGSNAALRDADMAYPSFDVDQAGEYVAQLIVNDGDVDSAPDTATISTLNSAPVADAGPDKSVSVGETVVLNGSGSSDVDGNALTYRWSLTKPAGSSAMLTDADTVSPNFEVDQAGEYVVQLIVHDGTLDSAPDTATISTLNSAPVAEAGPNLTASVGETVVLNGSGSSDADGDPLTYRWSLTKPAGSNAVLRDADTVSPNFEVDQAGEYMAQLIVHDGELESAPDVCTLVVRDEADTGDGIDAILSKMAGHPSRLMRKAAAQLKDALGDLEDGDTSRALQDVNRVVTMLQKMAARKNSDPSVGAILDELMTVLVPILKGATESEIQGALSVAEEGDRKLMRAQRHLRRALRNAAQGEAADGVINDFMRAARGAEEARGHEKHEDKDDD